jgi:hypothetical protein
MKFGAAPGLPLYLPGSWDMNKKASINLEKFGKAGLHARKPDLAARPLS